MGNQKLIHKVDFLTKKHKCWWKDKDVMFCHPTPFKCLLILQREEGGEGERNIEWPTPFTPWPGIEPATQARALSNPQGYRMMLPLTEPMARACFPSYSQSQMSTNLSSQTTCTSSALVQTKLAPSVPSADQVRHCWSFHITNTGRIQENLTLRW